MLLNPARYQGRFYQVYSQNAPYEPKRNGEFSKHKTIVEYTLNSEGSLNVKNTLILDGGIKFEIEGIASVDQTLGPYELSLVLVPKGQNPINSIYKIYYTDYDNFSIVGNVKGNYLSFLSRKETITQAELNLLFMIAKLNGFNVPIN